MPNLSEKVNNSFNNLFKNNRKEILNEFGAFTALIILCIVMSILSPNFLTTVNILNILLQISMIAIVAIGMTFVIITGGIDLSVGSIMALTGLIAAICMKDYNISVLGTVIITLIAGTIIGMVNGILITRFKLPPFIATLGVMSIARGAAYSITGGQPVYTFPEQFTNFAGRIGIVPIPVIVMFVIFIIAAYLLKNTRLGRYTYSIGGNETASILSGINVRYYKCIVYTINGLFCAVAAILLTARLDSAVPVAGDGAEMDAIAAVVIGGTSMMGGEGKISGTLIGALIIGVVSNGLNLLTVPQGPQRMIKGLIIIIAVIIDIIRKRESK